MPSKRKLSTTLFAAFQATQTEVGPPIVGQIITHVIAGDDVINGDVWSSEDDVLAERFGEKMLEVIMVSSAKCASSTVAHRDSDRLYRVDFTHM
jgi:hypothetical protein